VIGTVRAIAKTISNKREKNSGGISDGGSKSIAARRKSAKAWRKHQHHSISVAKIAKYQHRKYLSVAAALSRGGEIISARIEK